MITEDYVSFETAKLLKEKGFEQLPSLIPEEWICNMYDEKGKVNWGCYSDNWYCRITLQMAMKWLREVHHIFIRVIQTHIEYCTCEIYYDKVRHYNSRESYNSYEQACETAIKYCLEKLI